MLKCKFKKEDSSNLDLKVLGDYKKNKDILKEIEDLYKNKQEKILILKDVQKYINSIENMPEEFITSVENIDINIKDYEENICSLEDEANNFESINGGISGKEILTRVVAGVGIGISVFGEPSLKKLVATFGKASTGRKISGLHGAARTNAVLACLGGGSLDSGGKGMEGGKEVLKWCVPVGLTVTGISIASDLFLRWSKNNKFAKEVEESIAISNSDIEMLGAKVSRILANIKEYKIKDFNDLLNVDDLEVIKKKAELKSLIDVSEYLSIKLNEKI